MSRSNTRSAGFTMIELVVVIAILGIIAAVAAPRFFDDRTFLERGYYEELAAAIKYAQKLAVASGCAVQMSVSATGYVAHQQAAAGGTCAASSTNWSTNIRMSDGRFLSGAAPFGVTASPATFVFNSLGGTNLGSDLSIGIGPAAFATPTYSVTVRADSGFVQAP
ncbi:MAG TPA: GspH/FimT family pseudopilin [Gammaproteobacteria bacterium]|nr:GspH/FimT family pseudopilin [Gammaproteobacteria bacterium]